jgi:nucleotide-binding universal stress UspA family protein
MSESVVLLIVVMTWIAIGVTLSIVMGRRGYDAWNWLIVGAIMGPLAIVLVLTSRSRRSDPTVATSLRSGAGRIDVLVGLDGSPASMAAVDGAAGLFGDRLGRLTLATVIPLDAAQGIEREAKELLERTTHPAGDRIERVLLHGRPATALGELAATGRYDVLAIGRVGHGLSKTLLGSTATRLTHAADLPVLLFGGTTRTGDDPERLDRRDRRARAGAQGRPAREEVAG